MVASSEISAKELGIAGATLRADALAGVARVRQPDAVRPRFDPVDAPAARRVPLQPDRPRVSDRPPPPDEHQDLSAPNGRPRSAPSAPDAAFVTQSLAQESADVRPPVSAFLHGAGAYRQAVTGTPATPDVEVLSPFPRLASGRTLDLSV